ncbi:MAG TPA: poly-gamma-glutamate hydrolase family protein [Ilumatobacteraceae bacterium]
MMLAELLAAPGVREESVLRSRFGLMAFHGGSLEEMTDVIAAEVAARSGASYYGLLQPHDLQWHIPSHKVTPADSPTMATFLDHVDIVVTVHGYGRHTLFTALLLGGTNRPLAEHIAPYLCRHLPAYDIRTDLETIPADLRGQHPDNPVNLPRQRGVQIELPPRVRGSSPLWWDWEGPGPTPHTEALITGLAEAVSAWNL